MNSKFLTTIKAIHYAYPVFTFLSFLISFIISVCTLKARKFCVDKEVLSRKAILGLISGVIFIYLSEAFALTLRGNVTGKYPDEDQIVYLVASAVSFGTQSLVLLDNKLLVCYPYYITWAIGFIVEITLIVLILFHTFDYLLIAGHIIRICFFILLLLLSLYCYTRKSQTKCDGIDVERQSLLKKSLSARSTGSETSSNDSYGSTAPDSSESVGSESSSTSEDSYLAQQLKDQEAINKRLKENGDWVTYIKAFTIFVPYLWPFHNKALQLRAFLVVLCLFASNALNVFVPRQMGIMVDCLTKYAQGDYNQNIWIPAIIYSVLRYVSGESGIGWLRRWLWIPIEHYSYKALCTASHSHILSLSSDFHDAKSSSDLTQAVYGGRSVTELVETFCFQVVPMFLDLTAAFIYLCSQFGSYMGLILAITVVTYLYTTTKLYAKRVEKRRQYITNFRREWSISQESLDGWKTASLFNMIPHEKHRYESAVQDHLKTKKIFEFSTQLVSASQGLIMAVGLLAALSLGIYQVVHENRSTGQFTTLLVYWSQLYSKSS
ncbi:hypothetical protein K3495_g2591 [Podosphaera aphanis]|nr:hypothetical protein K3495_g2591 [Podosphaera aphanis]